MRGANVALVVARASRRRKPRTLFEEDGLFFEVASGWPLLRPGGCGDVAVASANWALLTMEFISKISAIRSHTYVTYGNVCLLMIYL